MQLHEKKLYVIEQLIMLNDTKAIKKIESIINDSFKRPKLKPLTMDELAERTKKANQDISDGKVFSQEEVEGLTNKW